MLYSDEKILKDNLCFAGTIYDSFEAMEEVMGKLKLEKPLFMIYLAKKAFAEEVFNLEQNELSAEVNRIELKSQTECRIN